MRHQRSPFNIPWIPSLLISLTNNVSLIRAISSWTFLLLSFDSLIHVAHSHQIDLVKMQVWPCISLFEIAQWCIICRLTFHCFTFCVFTWACPCLNSLTSNLNNHYTKIYAQQQQIVCSMTLLKTPLLFSVVTNSSKPSCGHCQSAKWCCSLVSREYAVSALFYYHIW